MNVLVIAPHPDDESIGCGGVVCQHSERGDRVDVVFLTSGELGLKMLPRADAWRIREGEARRAATVLGITRVTFLRQPDWMLNEHVEAAAETLAPVLKDVLPEIVYLPHPNEWHPDHKAALPVLRHALRAVRELPRLHGYEVWTPLASHDHAENITPFMSRKLRALRCHRSQLQDLDYVRAVRGLNAYRGAIAGRWRYGEVFQKLSATP